MIPFISFYPPKNVRDLAQFVYPWKCAGSLIFTLLTLLILIIPASFELSIIVLG